jgi:hypothetical protein
VAIRVVDEPRPTDAATPSSRPEPLRDPLDAYLRDVGHRDVLSREQEAALSREIEGSQRALIGESAEIGIAMPELHRLTARISDGRRLVDVARMALRMRAIRGRLATSPPAAIAARLEGRLTDLGRRRRSALEGLPPPREVVAEIASRIIAGARVPGGAAVLGLRPVSFAR